jgi:hypothetical protein
MEALSVVFRKCESDFQKNHEMALKSDTGYGNSSNVDLVIGIKEIVP